MRNFLKPYQPELVWERVSVINDLFDAISWSWNKNSDLNAYQLEVNDFILSKIKPHLLNSKTKKFFHSEDDVSTLEYIKSAIDSISYLPEKRIPYIGIMVGTEFEKEFINYSDEFEPSCEGAFKAQISQFNIILSKITALDLISVLIGVRTQSFSKVSNQLFSEKQQVIGRILFYGDLLGGDHQKQAMNIAIKHFTGGIRDGRPDFHMMSDLSNTGQTPGSYLSSDADRFYSDIVAKIKTFSS